MLSQAHAQELAAEKGSMRRAQRELRKQGQQLAADRRAKAGHLAELEGRARAVQLLKFGREVDLSLLDKLAPAQGTEELQARPLPLRCRQCVAPRAARLALCATIAARQGVTGNPVVRA